MNNDWEEDYWNGVNPAGYERVPDRVTLVQSDLPNPQGEVWKDRAYRLLTSQPFANSTVLELCCGVGFIVEDLVDFGVDAYGLDISNYAIGLAQSRRPDLASRFTVADARTDLQTLYGRNDFDYVFTWDSLSCFTDAEVLQLFDDLRVISRNQVHFTKDGEDTPDYYNPRNIQWYQDNRPSPQVTIVDIRPLL